MASTETTHTAFGGGHLVISEQCVNQLHRGVGCTSCADACPSGSITFESGLPVLDAAACVGCGACVPQCPTEAIGTTSTRRPLALAIADAPPGPLTLACPRGGTGPATMPIIRHERCLAALGADELLDLAGEPPRDLWLDDSPCERCELGEVHAVISETVGRANDLRRVFGLAPLVHRTTDATPEAAPPDVTVSVVIAGRGGVVSRRGLFRRISDVVTRGAFVEHDGGPPPRRERLLRHLRAAGAGQAPASGALVDVDVGFGDVTVDTDRCSACGLCAQFCPAGALLYDTSSTTRTGATFTLSFRPANCVACNACVVACPEQAIAMEQAVHPSLVLDGMTRTVAARPVARCEICAQATASSPDGRHRCFSCRDGVVSPMRDEAGLMADLIARTVPDPGASQ